MPLFLWSREHKPRLLYSRTSRTISCAGILDRPRGSMNERINKCVCCGGLGQSPGRSHVSADPRKQDSPLRPFARVDRFQYGDPGSRRQERHLRIPVRQPLYPVRDGPLAQFPLHKTADNIACTVYHLRQRVSSRQRAPNFMAENGRLSSCGAADNRHSTARPAL
jgi:hypothetical protein